MNGAIWDSRFRRVLYRVVVGIIVFLARVLVGLLAGASANTEFFDRYFTLLFKVNLVVGALLVLTVGALAMTLWVRYRRGKFGTRLMTKLAVFFGVVGASPGVLIYLASAAESSSRAGDRNPGFDVRVETKRSRPALNLGRSTIDSQLADLQGKARLMAEPTHGGLGHGHVAAAANRLREQYRRAGGCDLHREQPRHGHGVEQLRLAGVPDLPSGMLAEQARLAGGYAAVEGGTEPSVDGKRTGPIDSTHLYRIRVIISARAGAVAERDRRGGASRRRGCGRRGPARPAPAACRHVRARCPLVRIGAVRGAPTRGCTGYRLRPDGRYGARGALPPGAAPRCPAVLARQCGRSAAGLPGVPGKGAPAAPACARCTSAR